MTSTVACCRAGNCCRHSAWPPATPRPADVRGAPFVDAPLTGAGTKKVVCVDGGLGVAPIFLQARSFKESSGAYSRERRSREERTTPPPAPPPAAASSPRRRIAIR